MRFLSCFIVSITLLCSPACGQLAAPSPAVKKPPVKNAGIQAVKTDWREALTRNASAPVKIVEFFDYQCPFCASTIPALHEALKNNASQVQLILKHNPLSIHPDSMLAHQAALAAGEQGRFWEMHDLLFAHQRKVKLPDLLEYARQLHLNVPLFQKRLESGYYKTAVEQDIAMAEAVGVEGTPTFFINGQKLTGAQPVERLQSMISGGPDSEVAKADVSSLNLTGSPVRGQSGAPITVIEFSDLQCPFCARVVPTMQEVLKQYPTQVKWVFKNYPLDFHLDSPLAHQAVLAAGEQGKFWEMHDLVFGDQSAIKRDDLLQKARSLNLDMTRFTADLDSERIKRQVENDKREGASLGVSGTPAFFINGKEYSGAMPLEQFKVIINNELAGAPVPPRTSSPETVAKVQPDPEISLGPESAPITLVWFSDLQSNLTLKATLLVRQIMSEHPGKVRVIFKNRPLESHPDAMMLHEAVMAANAQGKFWEMHDLIIAAPQKTAKQDLIAYAQRIGLDVKRFTSELEANKYHSSILKDLEEARRRAVLGTPVFFLNSTRIDGLQPQKAFEELITTKLAQPVQVGSR